MKKILLSMIMLCTAVSAWSQTTYTTTSVTKKSTDGNNGIVNSDGFMIFGTFDKTTGLWKNGLSIGYFDYGHIITGVKFTMKSGTIDKCNCENWKLDETTGEWNQDGTFVFSDPIVFTSTTDFLLEKVTITYHKHTLTKNTDYKAATCTEPGIKDSWKCTDCGHIYYDEKGKNVANEEDLIIPIDPTNHASTLTKTDEVLATCVSEGNIEYWYCGACKHTYSDEACTKIVENEEDLIIPIDPANHVSTLTKTDKVLATCVSTGNVEYWHCKDCKHSFSDENGKTQIENDYVVTEIDPKNHGDKLKEVAFKNASVIEDGVYHHWHCEACGNDYADAECTKDMNGKTTKVKYDADALLIGNTTVDESYLFDGAKVTFDGDKVNLAIGSDNHQYDLSETERLAIVFSHTFKLKANQDPDKESNYYSTFYTSEGAYKVPATTTAYIGDVVFGEENDVLKLTDVGNIIHKEEAVILRATGNSITLMPSCNKDAASTDNKLLGTDEETTLGANDYALSLGQHGVGFYLWEGKSIGANKAYLTLDEQTAKALLFDFDVPTGIEQEASPKSSTEGNVIYNLNGVRVDKNYKGIVIKNGKKYLKE